VNLQRVN